ncbi:NADH-quinone oxidoreductase subunit N, partial [Micromonospora azadirachtae]
MSELKLPSIDYAALAPILIMLGAALVGVLVEAFVPRHRRHLVQLSVGLLAVLAALTMVVLNADDRLITAGSAIAVDGPTLFLQGAILVLAAMALLLIGERAVERGG